MNERKISGPMHISDSLLLEDELLAQYARLQYYKINYYKYTLLRPGFRETRELLRESIRCSLFHFCEAGRLLQETGFGNLQLAN